MPKPKRTPAETPSANLILAAIDRAERHSRGTERGVLLATVKEHLALPHNGGTTRQLRPYIDALHTLELIEPIRRGGMNLLAVTDAGRQELQATEAHVRLPEAPQHRRWREARTAATERIGSLHEELRVALTEANALLEVADVGSGTWFAAAAHLQQACRRLASATYCLNEWAEPNDAHADLDEPPHEQRGRRETQRLDAKPSS